MYLALTIGPIVETLGEAKKTKELFAGSYLFSYMMKRILSDLKDKKYDLIVPYHSEIDNIFTLKNGIGMFHDRLIVEKKTDDQTKIQEDIDKVIGDIIDNITDNIIAMDKKNNTVHRSSIKSFFNEYLQISYLITDVFSLKEIANSLDVFELHREFSVSPDMYKVMRDQEGKKVNPLVYLEKKFHRSFLKEDALGEDATTKFPSILEIALGKDIDYDFVDEKKNDMLEEQALIDVKNHKKYMALIQGDGDKIGAILKTMDTEPEKIKKFSEKLLDFTLKIPSIAKKYKATVVYAGGDDMLALSPMISEENHTVFDFLVELDSTFKETMQELELKEASNVSLSFGVSLIYYKKPLYQALNNALNNLFYGAKSNDNLRNRVVIELIKHSGQTYKIDIILGTNKYALFNDLLLQELNADTSALPHAVTHNIYRSLHSLKALAALYKENMLKSMLHNFFKNNFNKEVHQDKDSKQALQYCEDLLLEHMIEYQKEKQEDGNMNEKQLFKESYGQFASLLSTVKHLRGDRK